MKLIKTDNFDRDNQPDILLAENVNEYWGKKMVEFLNDKYSNDRSCAFFKLVPDEYKLKKCELP